jgi:protein SCO1/2
MKIATIGKIVSLFAIMVLAYMILTKDTELQYEVKGRVAGFSNTNTSIIIEHEKIEGYMDAMTMPFNVKDTSIITKLEVGLPIKFKYYVNLEDRSSYIYDIEQLNEGSIATLGNIASKQEYAFSNSQDSQYVQLGDILPKYDLIDQDGLEFSTKDLIGKKILLTFIYTNCPVPDYCPLMSFNFQKIHDKLDDNSNVILLSISFDPKRDLPSVLKDYGKKYTGTFLNWKFVTGKQKVIERITSDFSVLTQLDNDQIIHNLRTVYINEKGLITKIWPDNTWMVTEVLNEIGLK